MRDEELSYIADALEEIDTKAGTLHDLLEREVQEYNPAMQAAVFLAENIAKDTNRLLENVYKRTLKAI